MSDTDSIETLAALDPAKYEKIGLDHLVMYAVGELAKMNADLSFENIVVAAYRLFPLKFSLLGYPGYPDAKRIHDALFHCTYKTKQWLAGKTRQGFAVTDRSRVFIKRAQQLLSGKQAKTQRKKAASQTRRKETLLGELTSSRACVKFREGRASSVTKAEVCFALQGTLDSPSETLHNNLDSLKSISEELGHPDAKQFLIWLEKDFAAFLKARKK